MHDRQAGHLVSKERLIDPDLLRIPVGPGAVHVERYGHGGTPVVFLHGFGTSSFLWRAVAPRVAASQHTAVAIDLLGYGESDRPLDTEFSIAAQAEYLDRALTALRLPRAALVGVDLGGAVALRLAGARRERVSHLVLINSLGPKGVPSRDLRFVHRNTARYVVRVARGILGAAPILTPLLRGSVADPAHMPERLIARYLAPFVGRDGVNHLLALARAIRDADVTDIDLATVGAPTLIVRSDEDQWLDAEVATRLAARIADSYFVRLPGVGRLVPEEAPEQVATLVLDFVAGRTDPGHRTRRRSNERQELVTGS
jgi:pimeloyl-ACP methyl ester carboxylesterase